MKNKRLLAASMAFILSAASLTQQRDHLPEKLPLKKQMQSQPGPQRRRHQKGKKQY